MTGPGRGALPFVLGVLLVFQAQAGAQEGRTDLPSSETYLRAGVTAGTGGVPLVATLGLQEVGFGLELSGFAAPVSLAGEPATATFFDGGARLRLPVGWFDWFPSLGAGLSHLRLDAGSGGAAAGVRLTVPTVVLSLERAFAPASGWVVAGEVRYRAWPDDAAAGGPGGGGIALGRWSLGVGLLYRWELPERIRESGLERRELERSLALGQWEPEGPYVSASGRVDTTTLPGVTIRNGRWSASADLESGIGSFTIEATVNGHRESFTISSSDARYRGGRLVLSETLTATSDGKLVTGAVTVEISRSSMRLSVSARRSDGLTASASLRGSTTSFHVNR